MGEWKGERREFVLTLIVVEKEREREQNKQRKLWINQQTRRGQGRSETLCSISSPVGGGRGEIKVDYCSQCAWLGINGQILKW